MCDLDNASQGFFSFFFSEVSNQEAEDNFSYRVGFEFQDAVTRQPYSLLYSHNAFNIYLISFLFSFFFPEAKSLWFSYEMHSILLILFFISSVIALEKKTFFFLSPPEASSTDPEPLSFQVNTPANLSWVTNLSNYTITLTQHAPGDTKPLSTEDVISTEFTQGSST